MGGRATDNCSLMASTHLPQPTFPTPTTVFYKKVSFWQDSSEPLLRSYALQISPRHVDYAVSSNMWTLESVFQGWGSQQAGRKAFRGRLTWGGGNPVWSGGRRANRKSRRLCWPRTSCSVSPGSRADPGKTALVSS